MSPDSVSVPVVSVSPPLPSIAPENVVDASVSVSVSAPSVTVPLPDSVMIEAPDVCRDVERAVVGDVAGARDAAAARQRQRAAVDRGRAAYRGCRPTASRSRSSASARRCRRSPRRTWSPASLSVSVCAPSVTVPPPDSVMIEAPDVSPRYRTCRRRRRRWSPRCCPAPTAPGCRH